MHGVAEIRREVHRERREEFRRLTGRFIVAALLDQFTHVCSLCRGEAGSNPTKTGHVAYSWASEFNLWAHLCFLLVMFQVAFAPEVVERMRKIRQECDIQLMLGLIFVMISLSFLAYLRWFVVIVGSV